MNGFPSGSLVCAGPAMGEEFDGPFVGKFLSVFANPRRFSIFGRFLVQNSSSRVHFSCPGIWVLC